MLDSRINSIILGNAITNVRITLIVKMIPTPIGPPKICSDVPQNTLKHVKKSVHTMTEAMVSFTGHFKWTYVLLQSSFC